MQINIAQRKDGKKEPPPIGGGSGESVEALHATPLRATSLRGARLLLRGGLPDLPFDVADAGEGPDANLVVGPLDTLFAFPLGPPAAQERAQVAAEEAQGDGDNGRAREREDGVYGDDRGRRRLGVRAGEHARAEDDEHYGGDQSEQHARDRPGRVEPLPEDRHQDDRHVRARGDREGQRHEEGHVQASQGYGQDYRGDRDAHGRDTGGPELLALARLAVAYHVGVEVVGEGAGGGDHQPGDHGHDGGEGHRRDEGEEDGTAELIGELRSSQVARRVGLRDGVLSDEERRAVAEDRGQQIEEADDPGRRDDRGPGGLRVRHGEEADQDVGQPR